MLLKDQKTGRFTKNLDDKECFYCKKVFHPRVADMKFCSKKCNGLANTKDHSRTCVQCSKVFSAKSMKTKFCSLSCSGISRFNKENRKCKLCDNTFVVLPSVKKIYCSKICLKSDIKRVNKNCENCLSIYQVVPAREKTTRFCSKTCFGKYFRGEKSCHYKLDRTALRMGDDRFTDYRHKVWAKEVKNRDKWSCRIADNNCDGRLEAHHILPWNNFPELRYEVNNGITLCRHHHPRKKSEVEKLSPYFQKLVASFDQN